jgi:chromate reductase, NAD(P)H dehydrogenase (quinone)
VHNEGRVRVLAISGGLRRPSSNSALAGAAVRLAPDTVEMSLYWGLADLPLFNPDLAHGPAAVTEFRARLQACDALLISSPESAHGIVKNGLDWVGDSGELIGKPIALINTSAHATHAWASLAMKLAVMSARVLPEASITVSLDGRTLDANSIVGDATLSTALRSAIEALAFAARCTRVSNADCCKQVV